MAVSDIDEGDVLGAIELLDDPTHAEFLDSLHFKPATQYRFVHQGRLYDSKAVVGIAHGVATGQFWTSDDLYGGVAPGAAAWALRKLGFFIDDGPIYELTQPRVDRTHGKPAPYQYVVLLWAISRARSGTSRLAPFHDVSSDLATMLAPFAIAKTAPDPAMPWFALRDTAWVGRPDTSRSNRTHGCRCSAPRSGGRVVRGCSSGRRLRTPVSSRRRST